MKEKKQNTIRLIIAISLICAGIICVTAGFLRGEAAEVFRKATKICLECIGIG